MPDRDMAVIHKLVNKIMVLYDAMRERSNPPNNGKMDTLDRDHVIRMYKTNATIITKTDLEWMNRIWKKYKLEKYAEH